MTRRLLLAACAAAIVAGYAVLQYRWLPPDGFLSGDSGTKYLQARAVLLHGPLHPWIDGPSLDIDTTLRWQEPFLLPHNGHLVGVFPWLFAWLTAPFLGSLGLYGLYAVPAISVAMTFLATARIGRALGEPGAGIASGWCAVLATPVLFYGAELWEHAPAVALSTCAGALLLEERRTVRQPVLAGVLLAVAFALRPEAIVVGPAFLIARAAVRGIREASRDLRPLAVGIVLAAGVVAAANVAIYGAVVPQHVTSNFEAGYSYWAMRREAVMSLLLPIWDRKIFVLALMLVGVATMLPARRARVRLMHLAVLALVAVGVGVPLWRTYVDGLPWLATFGTRNLAHTFPLVGLLAYGLLWRRGDDPSNGRERLLWLATLGVFVLVFVTLPHTGGAQWSARFFLPAAPFVAALAVQLARRRPTRFVAVIVIAASMGVQIYGLMFLREFKRINAYITHATARATQPGDVIVSDLYWYPEITATLYPSRRLLFAHSPADVEAVAAAAAAFGAKSLWVVTATTVTGYAPPPAFADAAGRPVFIAGSIHDPAAASLSFHRYVRP